MNYSEALFQKANLKFKFTLFTNKSNSVSILHTLVDHINIDVDKRRKNVRPY